MRVLDLFSGIGGFSLGLERAGFKTVAFCEIEPFCRKVLKKHWPEVKIYEDVRTLTATRLAADGISVDVICGGFPCQDISVAGHQRGIDGGERSGLWSEIARLVGELRPQYVIVENVAALLYLGLDRVLGDLAALGYDAEWHCIPAAAVGAPQLRDRVWIVAYPNGIRQEALLTQIVIPGKEGSSWSWLNESVQFCRTRSGGFRPIPASRTCGMDYGVPESLDRLKAIGNAVVPQIPELIGRAILKAAA